MAKVDEKRRGKKGAESARCLSLSLSREKPAAVRQRLFLYAFGLPCSRLPFASLRGFRPDDVSRRPATGQEGRSGVR